MILDVLPCNDLPTTNPYYMSFDVFICYSLKDIAQAEQLRAQLEKVGIRCWFDRNIHGAEDFLNIISKRIIECKVVVFIATKASANSRWTRREILFADDRNKPIVPYLVDGFTFSSAPELDLLFKTHQWDDNINDVVHDVYQLCYGKELTDFDGPPKPELPWHERHAKAIKIGAIMLATFALLLLLLLIFTPLR